MSTEIKKHYAYFSAAIRDGAKLRPQATGGAHRQRNGSCAIIAGVEAMTGERETDGYYRTVTTPFPYLLNGATCPAPHEPRCAQGDNQLPLIDLIWHLNDGSHNWTRERIAAWLYSVEESLGFVTVLETQDTCNTKDNNLTQDCQASQPEEVFA